MSFTRWLHTLRSVIAPAGLERQRRSKPSRCRPAARYRPQLEVLEDRVTPATLTVTTPLDAVDPNDGLFSLREAINAASNGDQITFDQSLNGSTINLTQGKLLINKNLDILGPGANNLAVSGQNLSRVFEIAFGVTDTISGLTIKNGRAAGYGGGIYNDRGTLTISNSTLTGNSAIGGTGGGGIFNGGTMTVSGSTLSGNSGDEGGGIFNNGSMTVSGSTLFGNSAVYGGHLGGGIYNSGTMTVSDSTLSDNFGSGIFSGSGTLNVTDSTLSRNSGVGIGNYRYTTTTVTRSTLSDNFGAGIGNRGTLTVSDSTLSRNSGGISNTGGRVTVTGSTLSRNRFGGISNGNVNGYPYFFLTGTMTISNSTLSGNFSGGINNGGTMTVSGSTLSGNSGYNGGGIHNGGTLTVNNSSTISGNSAVVLGGGIYNSGTLNVTDSTVCGNTAPVGADLFGTATLTNSHVCVINQATTTTTVTSSSSPSVFGQVVTFTARVRLVVPGWTPTLTGTVTFLLDGSTPLGAGTVDGSGQATLTTSGVPLGAHTITATYGGDASSLGSTSAVFTQTVLATASTTTTVTSSISPSVFGQVVTFTARVGADISGAGTPTGTVTFLLNGTTTLGASTLDSSGRATLATARLPVGTHTITASYAGAGYFTASTSAVLTQTVLSAQQQIALIVGQVNALVNAGILDSGNGNALSVTLNNATASLNSGNTTAGVNQLKAVINQINALVTSGKLTSTDAQPLLSAIDEAIAAALASPI